MAVGLQEIVESGPGQLRGNKYPKRHPHNAPNNGHHRKLTDNTVIVVVCSIDTRRMTAHIKVPGDGDKQRLA